MTFQEVLNEMAQSHINNEIAELMLDGNFEKAAEKYIDNIEKKGGKLAKTSTATTKKMRKRNYAKGLQADKELVDKITDDMWDKFDAAYREQVGTKEGEETTKKKTKGTAQKTGEGETEIKTSAQGQKPVKDRLEKKVVKTRVEYEQMLKNTDDEDKKEEIQAHIDGLNVMIEALRASKKGAVLPAEKQEELKQRYDKIQKNVSTKLDKQDGEDEDEDDTYDEKEAQAAVNKIRSRIAGIKDYDDAEQLWRDWLDRKKSLQNESKIESGIKSFFKEVIR